jgi:hypothetical protein
MNQLTLETAHIVNGSDGPQAVLIERNRVVFGDVEDEDMALSENSVYGCGRHRPELVRGRDEYIRCVGIKFGATCIRQSMERSAVTVERLDAPHDFSQ